MVLIQFANEPVHLHAEIQTHIPISISPEQLPAVVPYYCHPLGSRGF